MKKLILILFLPIILNAQNWLLFSGGDDYKYTINIGDSNSIFSDTTSTGDWFATANDSVYNGGDSTLIGSHIDGYIGLPLASTAGQKYRATMQMKEYGGTVAPQPIISYGTKSQTKTALSDSWQNYIFDFTGEKVNDYYSFDGVNDYVSVADDNSLDMGLQDWSLEFYFKLNSIDRLNLIGGKRNTLGYLLYITAANKLETYFDVGATILVMYPSYVFSSGTYYHLVLTYDRDGYERAYLDGSQIDSLDISGQSAVSMTDDTDISLGKFFSNYGDITFETHRQFNKALSQSEITTLYNNRNSTSPTTVTDSLVLDLNGIDGNASASTWTDQSGNGNDGTVNGATLWQPPFLKISLSDTAKVKIDNVKLRSNKP